MATITIPRKLIKEKELILIPRRDYEKLLRIAKKKRYTKLGQDLDEIIKEVKKGKTEGPFHSVKELRSSLEK